MVQARKKVALLHRYPADQIPQTNAAYTYLKDRVDTLTYKDFDRLSDKKKFFKSLLWIFYAPLLVIGKGYDVIYCDDSFPFYPALVKLVCPKSKVVIRLGDFHLMYYTSGWVYRALHFFEVLTWRVVDIIIAISPYMVPVIATETEKLVVSIRDSVDPLNFLPANTLKPEGQVVMFHGLLTRNKNVDILLEAARRLPNVWFRIVGDGPDKKRLEDLAPYNVYFVGWKPFNWMASQINRCSIGVALRSDNPGNEYVVTSPFLQYGMMGKPCIVSRRRVFGDYQWQFRTVEDLVVQIVALLSRPEEGEKLKKFVMEHHDARKIAEEIWSLLSS